MRLERVATGEPLEPGVLAGLCYQHGWTDCVRLHEWLAIVYAASDGMPGLVTYELVPVNKLARGALCRVWSPEKTPGDVVWAVASSGILTSADGLSGAHGRLQVPPESLVVAGSRIGLAQLKVRADFAFRVLGSGDGAWLDPHLNMKEARRRVVLRRYQAPEVVAPLDRVKAATEIACWLAESAAVRADAA